MFFYTVIQFQKLEKVNISLLRFFFFNLSRRIGLLRTHHSRAQWKSEDTVSQGTVGLCLAWEELVLLHLVLSLRAWA